MDGHEESETGTHPPSGPWRGHYLYPQGLGKGRMDLTLTFAHGQVRGMGNDPVGLFVIRGRYDPATGECTWTKTYPGMHDVFYRGFYEGRSIWGTWDIREEWRGGFQIWPKGEGEGLEAAAEEEVDAPVDAVPLGHPAAQE